MTIKVKLLATKAPETFTYFDMLSRADKPRFYLSRKEDVLCFVPRKCDGIRTVITYFFTEEGRAPEVYTPIGDGPWSGDYWEVSVDLVVNAR